jgi:histone acetyltransferase (RNA polymerase elongator complex component)
MIIPFFIIHSGCPHQCVFCNQKSITGQHHATEAAAIPEKIDRYLRFRTSSNPVQVAFYGGSFTALPLSLQHAYLDSVRPFILNGTIKSIRISTRPDAISTPILSLLKQNYVSIVELGAQSMNDRVLTLAGRGHKVEDTEKAARVLSEHGFTVGLQLMPGLPGDTPEDFLENTIVAAVAIKPSFIRLYPTLVVKGTPLENMYKIGGYTSLSLGEAVALCAESVKRIEAAGIEVIRLGLQSTEMLDSPGTVLTGPYHPAFGQLVESALLLDRMRAALKTCRMQGDSAVFAVSPPSISSATGQRRENVKMLIKEFALKKVSIVPDSTMKGKRDIKLLTL